MSCKLAQMLQIGSLVKIHIFGKFKIRVEISNWNQLAKIASNQKSIIDDDGLRRAQQQQRVNSTVIILFNLDNSENRISLKICNPFSFASEMPLSESYTFIYDID